MVKKSYVYTLKYNILFEGNSILIFLIKVVINENIFSRFR